MNVLQQLDEEMKNKKWSLEEKKRFLYLRSCQLFTYDTRQDFLCSKKEKIEIHNASYLLNEILTREIDLENMTDNRVNCISWSKAYKKMQKELLNTNAKVVNNESKDHYWVNFGHKADATYNSDLTRVKMNLHTLGYELSTDSDQFIPDNESEQKIKRMDQNIKYITKDYCHLTPLIQQLQQQFQDSNLNGYDQLFWWMERLRETYLHFQPNLPYFEDAFIGVSYLVKYFLANLSDEIKPNSFHQILFDDSANDWCFVDLYRIEYSKDIFYYAVIKGKNGYDFMEIPYLDVVNYVTNLKGFGKELLLKK